MMADKAKVFLGFLAFVFLTFFFIQTWDQVGKYLSTQTTMVIKTIQDDKIVYPAIAICPSPGYKTADMARHNIPRHQWATLQSTEFNKDLWRAPSSKEELAEWFNISTYSVKDIFEEALVKKHNETFVIFSNGKHLDKTVGEIILYPSAYFGMCYMVRTKRRFTIKGEYLQIKLKYPPGVEEHQSFVFEQGSETYGLVFNAWYTKTLSTIMRPDTQMDVFIDKKIKKLLHFKRDCQEGMSRLDHEQCFIHHVQKQVKLREDQTCYWPFLQSWPVRPQTCQSPEGIRKTINLLTELIVTLQGKTGHCPGHCLLDEISYHSRQVKVQLTGSRRADIFVFYTSTDVEVSEEVLMYDFNDIVAAVGGSLGLFLGFSCLDFGRLGVGWLKGKFVWCNSPICPGKIL